MKIIKRWRHTVRPERVEKHFSSSPSVGNKNDDPARKQVDTQDAVRFGESMGVRVFETSAKENINVEEV